MAITANDFVHMKIVHPDGFNMGVTESNRAFLVYFATDHSGRTIIQLRVPNVDLTEPDRSLTEFLDTLRNDATARAKAVAFLRTKMEPHRLVGLLELEEHTMHLKQAKENNT